MDGRQEATRRRVAWQDESGWTPIHANGFWGPEQPNNHNGNQNCLAIWGDAAANHVQWCDMACENKYSFMCEKREKREEKREKREDKTSNIKIYRLNKYNDNIL